MSLDTMNFLYYPVCFQTTIKMLAQQRTMFETGEDKVPNRIVSLDKDYIRPL